MTAPLKVPEKAAHGLDLAREVLRIEAREVEALASRLDASFEQAVELILQCQGRVVVSGMGKSGHIGRKIAATLASTGTPAFFMHPAEASHGDLGMVTRGDVVLALSYSGESSELLEIVPLFKRLGVKVISMTGNAGSSLARESNVHLDAHITEEACSLGLAPTSSTTAALALGDALAVALLDARGFSAEDFARSHPGGALGRRLLVHVRDIMRSGSAVPCVSKAASLSETLLEMTRGGIGMTAIVDEQNHPIGIFTDGDLRRILEQGVHVQSTGVATVMHTHPQSIHPNRLAVEAVELMEARKINQLLVVDDSRSLVGALNMHDLLRAKVI
ncbi:arabinose-5-phosphate isomerase [Novimethylophilus kurashikiensis]|uniref:Arabinose-5-phosphate isomerase n=1 Tax=Novimethylophilus kurashikiensis TaxID=1825523 RepID=A0A2R5F7Y1_9PROT|nr:KpsF/GutQ family sugar-phosphate isomerase [Novimethylophilus kurashikiensis]GBG13658.1 arabinose-5-phosphate isomerase [Novimethylophilus kurashikiensis]